MPGSFKNKKAQSTAEYVILIAIIVAVAIGMQTYIKRGVQARVRDASDEFYNNFTSDTNWGCITSTTVTPLTSKQYEPENLSSKSTQNVTEDIENFSMAKDGTTSRATSRKTKQAIGDYQKQDY